MYKKVVSDKLCVSQISIMFTTTTISVQYGQLEVCIHMKLIKHEISDSRTSTNFTVGLDSAVGTATRYGLDGPGIEHRRGKYFTHPSRPALEPTKSHTI